MHLVSYISKKKVCSYLCMAISKHFPGELKHDLQHLMHERMHTPALNIALIFASFYVIPYACDGSYISKKKYADIFAQRSQKISR